MEYITHSNIMQKNFYLILLLIHFSRSENNIFYPLLKQFSDIAKEFDGNSIPLPKVNEAKASEQRAVLETEVLGHPEVETSSGRIIGASYSESHAFYSIPFGKAPIGELR